MTQARTCKSLDAAYCMLRSRIMLKACAVRFPQRREGEEDIELIRRALTLYINTWVLPILDAIQDGRAQKPQWTRGCASLGQEPLGARMPLASLPPSVTCYPTTPNEGIGRGAGLSSAATPLPGQAG
jgi:hypothetical protein